MNGTNEAKGLWIHYRNKQTEKNTDYFFKNGFFKSFMSFHIVTFKSKKSWYFLIICNQYF